jgi:hypothetical protein
MDILEKEAALELNSLGFKSAWGCKDGVFLSSEDAFRQVKLIKSLLHWCNPNTERKSFNEVMDFLRDAMNQRVGQLFSNLDVMDSAANSGKSVYSNHRVVEIDLE